MKHKFSLNYDKKIVPKSMNPELSEKDEKDLKFFLEHGYLVVDDALNTDEVNNIREAFNDTFKKLDNVKHIEVGLLEYDKRFLKLLDNKIVIKKIKSILGNCIQLHSATARLCKPGEPNQIWHRDGPWVGRSGRRPRNKDLTCQNRKMETLDSEKNWGWRSSVGP